MVTVKDCLEYWKKNYVDVSLRENSRKLYKSTVIKRLSDAFKGRPVADIKFKQWVDLFTQEERKNGRRARQLLVQLRSAMGWCIRRHFIPDCVVTRVEPCDVGSRSETRDIILTYYELADIWVAIERSSVSTNLNKCAQDLTLCPNPFIAILTMLGCICWVIAKVALEGF